MMRFFYRVDDEDTDDSFLGAKKNDDRKAMDGIFYFDERGNPRKMKFTYDLSEEDLTLQEIYNPWEKNPTMAECAPAPHTCMLSAPICARVPAWSCYSLCLILPA